MDLPGAAFRLFVRRAPLYLSSDVLAFSIISWSRPSISSRFFLFDVFNFIYIIFNMFNFFDSLSVEPFFSFVVEQTPIMDDVNVMYVML